MPNVSIKLLKNTSVFRKIAMGTWKVAKDPSVYGEIKVDMTHALAHLEEYQKKHNVKITPAHLVGRAVTYCMRRRPEINGFIRGSRIYLRDNVALFYQVNIPGEGEDKIKKATLAGAVIHEAEGLNLAQLAFALSDKASRIRDGRDVELKNNMNLFKLIPWCLCGLYLDFVSWLMYGLNLNLRWLGVPQDPFGSIMITNVGSLGIDIGWAPLVAYSRVPVLLALGAVTNKPWVVADKIEIRPILSIGVTFDHRMVDGIHASQMAAEFKKCFENPLDVLFNDNLKL